MSERIEGNSFPQSGAGVPRGPRAGFWRRFAAVVVDGLLLGIPLWILATVIDPLTAQGLYTLASLAYFTLLEGGLAGQTLGKKALGIRVVGLQDGASIGYGRAFIRWLGRIVSSLVLLLGYLWMLWDKEKQTWHDKFASSIVVPESAYRAGV